MAVVVTDSAIDFVLMGYDRGDSHCVLARGKGHSIALAGFCLSGGEDVEIDGRHYHRIESSAVKHPKSKDTRDRKLRFAWSTDNPLSAEQREKVREILNRHREDLQWAFSAGEVHEGVALKYLGQILYRCESVEADILSNEKAGVGKEIQATNVSGPSARKSQNEEPDGALRLRAKSIADEIQTLQNYLGSVSTDLSDTDRFWLQELQECLLHRPYELETIREAITHLEENIHQFRFWPMYSSLQGYLTQFEALTKQQVQG